MKIAIPVANGLVNMHFGHSEIFALIDVDQEAKSITNREDIKAPPHEPGLLPKWLAEKEVELIIAGGMGQRAMNLFAEKNIKVITGASPEAPETLINAFLNNSLQSGRNACDH